MKKKRGALARQESEFGDALLEDFIDDFKPAMRGFFERFIPRILETQMVLMASWSEEELRETLDEFRERESD